MANLPFLFRTDNLSWKYHIAHVLIINITECGNNIFSTNSSNLTTHKESHFETAKFCAENEFLVKRCTNFANWWENISQPLPCSSPPTPERQRLQSNQTSCRRLDFFDHLGVYWPAVRSRGRPSPSRDMWRKLRSRANFTTPVYDSKQGRRLRVRGYTRRFFVRDANYSKLITNRRLHHYGHEKLHATVCALNGERARSLPPSLPTVRFNC